MWIASKCNLWREPHQGGGCEDDGQTAWRVVMRHDSGAIPLPFQRRVDCQRAAELLNRELPIDGMPREDAYQAILARYGSLLSLRRYLVRECCAW